MGGEHVKFGMDKTKLKEAGPILQAMNIKKYSKIGVIGRGGFGKVTDDIKIGMESGEQER